MKMGYFEQIMTKKRDRLYVFFIVLFETEFCIDLGHKLKYIATRTLS